MKAAFVGFCKRHRNALITVAAVLGIAALLALNILFPYLVQKKARYIDMTPEGLYTLSDEMIDACGALKGDITVTFCADPDNLLSNYEARYVYIMAMQLANRFDNIHVETYDINLNPTAVNRFKATSATRIMPYHVIVSCESRYRILSAASFWSLGDTSTSNTDYYSFNGEYRMATAFLSVSSVTEPVVCFAYGHGEKIYVDESDAANASLRELSDSGHSAFYTLMRNQGFKVAYIDLDREEIPDDCVLLVMDSPTADYAAGNPASMTERTAFDRMHDFLSEQNGALMLFKSPEVELPNLEDYMEYWGIGFRNGQYLRDDASHTLSDTLGTRQKLIATLIDDESSVANAIYADVVGIASSPRTVVENSGSVYKSWINDYVGSSGTENVTGEYHEFFTTSPNANAYTPAGELDSQTPGTYALGAISLRKRNDTVTGNGYYSYVFCAASTELTTNTYLDNRAYSNYDILFATVRYISRVDEYASMELGGTSLNSPKLGGKPLLKVTLDESGNKRYDENGIAVGYYSAVTSGARVAWMTVLIAVPVVAGTVTGAVILLKRRNR